MLRFGHGAIVVAAVLLGRPAALRAAEIDHSLLLVGAAAKIEGVDDWTIETRGFRAKLRAMAFARDGREIAVAGDAGVVRIFDAATGKLRRVLIGHGGSIRAICYLPDGKTFATAAGDGAVRVWEAQTGKPVRTMAIAPGIRAAAFSADGGRLLTGGAAGDVRLWDMTSGRAAGVLKGHAADVDIVALSPDGAWAAVGGDGGRATMWDAGGKAVLASLDQGITRVGGLAWSPDGALLAFAEGGEAIGALFVWDRSTKKVVRTIKQDVYKTNVLAWSPGGKQLVCRATRGTLKAWDTTSWQAGREFEAQATHAGRAASGPGALWSPDGQHLAVCRNRTDMHSLGVVVSLYQADSGKQLWRRSAARARFRAAAMSPDAKRMACNFTGGNFPFQMWDLAPAEVKTAISRLSNARLFVWSPDSKSLATERSRIGGGVSLWDAETGAVLRDCRLPDGTKAEKSAVGAAWAPDGKRVVAVSAFGGEPTIFNTATGKAIGKLRGRDADDWNDMAWSSDGKLIAMAGGESRRGVTVWSARTGRLLGDLRGPEGKPAGLAFSPDGRRVVCAGEDGKCVVWALRSGRASVLRGSACPSRSVAWSPNGRTILAGQAHPSAAGPASVMLWDARSGRPLPPLTAHPGSIVSVGWSRDGKVLFSAGRTIARMWRFPQRLLALSILPTGESSGLAISGEGHYRLSGDVEPEKELVYVVVVPSGQQTLSPADFARRYGWANTPSKVRP